MEVIRFTAWNAELKMKNMRLTKPLKSKMNYKKEYKNGKP